jgi:hypothetical protein
MHALAKERIAETEALVSVVEQVKKFVNGEMLAASFRQMVKDK